MIAKKHNSQIGSVLRALVCPECSASSLGLQGTTPTEWPRRSVLVCQQCRQTFEITDYVPRLLPTRVSRVYSELQHDVRVARKGELRISIEERQRARNWLLEVLGLEGELGKARGIQLWRDLAILRRISDRRSLSEAECHELVGMYAAFRMARHYRARVADQLGASLHATLYERYEDILLRVVMSRALADPTVLVELGSGVGRVLHQYASCLRNEETSATYKHHFPLMYEAESLPHSSNLVLLLGLDFQERMLAGSYTWLRESNLGDLIGEARVVQVAGSVQHLPIRFGNHAFGDSIKVVCMLFQTIGNQLTGELRARMLSQAWDAVGEKGALFVSAFNGKAFKEQAVPYYRDIRASVGKMLYSSENTFISSRGVYSKWMTPAELEEAFRLAGIQKFLILTAKDLPIVGHFEKYLDTDSQKKLRKRALVGVAWRGADLGLDSNWEV